MRRLVIAVVIAALIVMASFFGPEINLFCDRFIIPSKPMINISYTPTKVINDKVYDIRVHVEVKDDKTPIAYAKLLFIPVKYDYFITEYRMRPEDYPRAFPNINDNRTFVLRPVDGRFDELREEFVVDIKNITGGGEYRIVVIARDAAGNENVAEIKTPYIRQFENFGKQLYEKGMIVGAIYEPWDMKIVVGKYDLPDKPLLGLYDASDEIVQWKHVDWATGHGVNVFYVDGGFWEEWKAHGREGRIIRGLMEKGMKCAVLWGWLWEAYFKRGTNDSMLPDWIVDLGDSYNAEKFEEVIRPLLESGFFNHPNFFKISGKSVIFIYDEVALIHEKDTILNFRKEFERLYGVQPYLIADTLFRIPSNPANEYERYFFSHKNLEVFDAFASGAGFMNNLPEFRPYAENYDSYYEPRLSLWSEFAHSYNKKFVPTVIPGFYNGYSWGPKDQIPIARNAELFEKRIKSALKYAEEVGIRIDTWNDFGEWTYIEPSVKEGFAYLSALKEALRSVEP